MGQDHNLPDRMKKHSNVYQRLTLPCQRDIMDCIGTGQKSSKEIYDDLRFGRAGISLAGLYYHLSALKRAEIIELASYRETKKWHF